MQLEPIKARLRAATPGPWKMRAVDSTHGGVAFWEILEDSPLYSLVAKVGGVGDLMRRDAELIAAAPADLSALVAEVEQLRADLAHARHMIECDDDKPCRECKRAAIALGYEDDPVFATGAI